MPLSRRRFLAGLGGSGLVFAFDLGCARDELPSVDSDDDGSEARLIDAAINAKMDYRGWLVVAADGTVTAHTGRIELGQGLKTVLYDVICQALELPRERLRLVMGDTALCPDDGPTTGSSATRVVGWGYWLACHAVRNELLELASNALGRPAEDLIYRSAEILDSRDPDLRIGIGELGEGVKWLSGESLESAAQSAPPYVDRATLSAEAETIVTGTKVFAGDLMPGACLYGAFLRPDLHERMTRLETADLSSAAKAPGLVRIERLRQGVAAVGRTFTSVQKALAAVEAEWTQPDSPSSVDHEEDIRRRRKLAGTIQKRRNVERAFQEAARVVSETYVTQYASPAPIETNTALADVGDDEARVWAGTQNPFLARHRTAKALQLAEEKVRIHGLPPGGGFGEKAGHEVPQQAALLSRLAGEPVKYVYSRREQFQVDSSYKAAVVVDIATALSEEGKLLGRTIDIHQDRGKGTRKMYRIPNVLARRFRTNLSIGRKIMRGTSYTQDVFALESHTDSVARAAGIDAVEFRRRNVYVPEFRPLLDRCAEMMGYGSYEPPVDQGIGFAICYHGKNQLGAVGAEVSVDRSSGRIRVERLAGAFDVGVVMNRNTATMGVKGAMIWGLGYALFEEVELDAHRARTASFSDYLLPRFSDVPRIEIDFLDNRMPGLPRGCGEMPLPPTVAAICNAVYDAVGVRFYALPMTRQRVRTALAT